MNHNNNKGNGKNERTRPGRLSFSPSSAFGGQRRPPAPAQQAECVPAALLGAKEEGGRGACGLTLETRNQNNATAGGVIGPLVAVAGLGEGGEGSGAACG